MQPTRRLIVIALIALAAVALSPLLPTIGLTGSFADLIVRLTDTASTRGMPLLIIVTLIVFVTRPGPNGHRRRVEAGVVLAGIVIVALLLSVGNERIVKPLFAVPRPNVVALAETGQLGERFPTAEDFYDLGDKEGRRGELQVLLAEVDSPELSDVVRDHWAYETGYSFPSGHATAAMTFATAVSLLGVTWLTGWRRQTLQTVLPVWAVLVAYSRVLLEVHRPVDVAVGAVLGILLGIATAVAIKAAVVRLSPASPDPG